jgi:hypothetical protein
VKLELRLSSRVRDLVTSLPPDDRAVFEQCVDALCTNPYLDNVTNFAVVYPPAVLLLHQDGPFRMVYRIAGGVVVDLLNLDLAPDVPSIAEWEDWKS